MIRMIKSRRMRWEGHVARIQGEKECMQNFGGKARMEDTVTCYATKYAVRIGNPFIVILNHT
jgi:hypothetical protein